ncbi:ATPase, partial [mine drainage metagenome]
HIFITGSNASLLSKELGTHLTGRHIDIELYPFSFSEFLTAKGVKYGHIGYSTEEKALIVKSFKEYFTIGGMPEVVMLGNQQILIQLLGDIVQRDIANRYSIRKPNELKAVIRFLMANIGNVITYRSINENFGIMSANTLQKYIEYIEETYLIFTVKRYDPKLKRFDKNPRKVYCIDNGMVVKNVPQVAERGGSLLENLVAVHLKETCKEFYYFNYKGTAEADFILPRE